MAIENSRISDLDQTLSELFPRKRRRISSTSPVSKLGDDLLQEILIRLPNPRVACLCKLVCKPWSSLISNPRFNLLFVSHHQAASLNHGPMPEDPYELLSIIRSFLPPMLRTVQSRLRVLDCNRDLVLCGFWDLARLSDETSRSYLVCNPFTKQWVALPLAPRRYAHYDSRAARLVCEPRARIKLDLGGDEDDEDRSFIYSEHRFRVVCVCQAHQVVKLDVFCSESGEWTKDALAFDMCDRIGPRSVVSCNGELFFKYYASKSHDANNIPSLVAGFNPFRLDTPLAFIDVSPFFTPWFISNSQGALHLIALAGSETLPTRASVWRLGEDRKSWRKQCEGLVNRTSMYRRYETEGCFEPFLHPHKPQRVFFSRVADEYEISYLINKYGHNALMCCDLGREEGEEEAPTLFAKLKRKSDIHHLQVFVPRVSCCWATPIPQFQGGGSSSSEAAAECPSLHILRNCVDRVVKSTVYKDYIHHVISEATVPLLIRMINQKQREIKKIDSPDLDSEYDALQAACNVLTGDDGNATKRQGAELLEAVVHEMVAADQLPHPPPGAMKSIFWREPYCGGRLDLILPVIRSIIPSLKCEGKE